MSALRAKPYTRERQTPERSITALIRHVLDNAFSGDDYPETKMGQRGIDITNCLFKFPGRRDLNTASDIAGGYLAKSSQPATFFDAMIAASIVGRAGAETDRPNGDWSAIPAVDTIGELAWVDPNCGPIGETAMSFGARRRSAHLGTFKVDYSRQLRVITGGLTERVVLSEGARVLAAGLDKAALVGTGVNNQPVGLLSTPGLPSTSGATFSTTTAAELIRLVEAANGTPTAFLLSPTVAKTLRTRPRFTGTDTPILSGGKIADLPAFVTTAMPADKIVCGDFSRLTVCAESIEVLVNPYSQAQTGVTEVVFYLFADVVVAHKAAFALAVEVS